MLKDFITEMSIVIRLLFTLFILTHYSLAIGQEEVLNNWEEALSEASGKERISLIIELTKNLGSLNIETADSLIKEGLEIAVAQGDSLSIHLLNINLGKVYYSRNLFDKGITETQKSLNFFKRKKIKLEEAKAHLGLASLFIRKRDYQKADSLISEAESYFIGTNDQLWKCKIQYNRGIIYAEKRAFDKALNYFLEALRLSKGLDDVEFIARITGNVALMQSLQGNYTQALEREFQVIEMDCSDLTKSTSYGKIAQLYIYMEEWKLAGEWFNKSFALQNKLGRKCQTTSSLYGLGIVNKSLLNFKEAIRYYEKCLELQRSCNNQMYGSTLSALGNVYNEIGQWERANKYYDEQMKLAISQNNRDEIYYINYNKGYFAHRDKRYQEALKHTLMAYEIAVEKERLPYLKDVNELLADIYSALGEVSKSAFHLKEHVFYEDSIIGLKKIREVGAIEQKHLASSKKDGLVTSIEKDTSFFSSYLKYAIGIGGLMFLSYIAFSFFKQSHNQNQKTILANGKVLDQAKMDQYFEELFARLDQNTEEKANTSSTYEVKDMAKFLTDNLSTASDWKSFEMYFEKVHKDFFKILKTKFPNITTNELNMCALLKLNIQNKDIAQILGIGYDSVRKSQSLLFKKMELTSAKNLRDFILKL